MFYLTGSVTGVRESLDARRIGFMKTPNITNLLLDGWVWAADTGCYGNAYVGDERWFSWLSSFPASQREDCLFATAPDVVGDAGATLERSLPWLEPIRSLGYPVAYVAQDGVSEASVPWDAMDVLFIGGTTKWKLSEATYGLIDAAHARGKHVHVGRVNSRRRYLAFAAHGVRSADGTFISFGPDIRGPELLGWIDHHENNPTLFQEVRDEAPER